LDGFLLRVDHHHVLMVTRGNGDRIGQTEIVPCWVNGLAEESRDKRSASFFSFFDKSE
jgi:hypothetical protein